MLELNFIPIIVDEYVKSQNSSGKKLSTNIFNFNMAQDKSTSHKTTAGTSTSPFISTAEISVTKQMFNANTNSEGEFARFLEIPVDKGELTDDAEQAEDLKTLLKRNYGWLGLDVSQYLVDHDYITKNRESFEERFDDLKISVRGAFKIFKQDRETMSTERRLLEKITLILLSAEIINDATPLKIDIDEMREMLFAAVEEQCNYGKNAQSNALVSIQEYCNKIYNDDEHRYKICLDRKIFDGVQEVLYLGTDKRLYLTQNAAKEIFGDEIQNSLLTLRESGSLITTDDKHLSVQRMLNGEKVRIYEIDISEIEGEFLCEKEKAVSSH